MIDERFPKWDVDVENGTVYSLVKKRYVGSIGNYGYIYLPGYTMQRVIYMVGHNCNIPLGFDVHHINGIKTDNRLCNLELVKHKEHISERHKDKIITKEHLEKMLSASSKKRKGVPLSKEHREKIGKGHCKKVAQYTLDGELIKILDSAKEGEKYGFDAISIGDCCRGKLKTYKKYIWKFYIENGE